MGIVDTTMSRALEAYLEENREKQKILLPKLFCSTARAAARKARELVQRKSVLTGGGLAG